MFSGMDEMQPDIAARNRGSARQKHRTARESAAASPAQEQAHGDQRPRRQSQRNALTGRWARALLEGMADGFLAVDDEEHITYVNASVEQVLGRGREELLGRSAWEVFPEAIGLSFFWQYHRVKAYRAPVQFEAYYSPLDIWLEVRLSMLPDGGVAAYLGDISARKRLEEEHTHLLEREQTARNRAEEAERRSRVTFEQAAIGIAHVAPDGQLLRVNDRTCAILGRTRDELLAHTFMDITYPADLEADLANVRRLLAGELTTFSMEKRYVRPDGSLVWGDITVSLVRDTMGTPEYFIGTLEDITEQRRWEQQRVDILRTVAHDLANPVTAVRMYLQTQQRRLSKGEPPFVPSEALLDNMMHAVMRIERLLGDFKAAISIETDTLRLDMVRCDLVDMCRKETEIQRAVSGREIVVELPVAPVRVLADVDRIEQVIANLLSNAVKYSPPIHPVWLTLRSIDGYAHVAVRDEGMGIPEAELQHVWEQFHRVTGADAQDGSGGLGLGLYICKSLVERHGGEVGAESVVGKGSTFWFTLPLASSDT